jgi:large repetitive protein
MRLARLACLRTALIALPLITLSLAGCANGGPDSGGGDTACSNGVDDDGDGLVDFPADPGCTSADDNDETNMPQCNDGIDNDGDGKIDYPDDPGCLNPNQNDEADDCPDGPNCPQCGNGLDDDGDGETDFPDDSGCMSASDDSEVAFDANACGTGVTVLPLPPDGKATGTLVVGSSHLSSPTCGGGGAEIAYAVTVGAPTTLVATTAVAGTGADTVLYLRSDCVDYQTEVGCNDNASSGSGGSTLTADVGPGTYYLVVDGQAATTGGNFNLEVARYPGAGESCDPVTDGCAPGYYCRQLPGTSGTTCEPPRCSDGVDNDGDGKTDFPDEPGCTGPGDDDEADTCPDGADCPACSNGQDDDNDGHTDYPDDPDCASASQDVEGCGTEQDPLGQVTSGTVTGDTSSYHDDISLSCNYGDGADAVELIDVPALESLTLDTYGSTLDTVIGMFDSTCGGTQLACNDEDPDGSEIGPSKLTVTNLPAGLYAVVVDGYDGDLGAFQLNASGVIAAGGRCDGALYAAGVLACTTGTACDGSTCKGTLACNDGVDDDSDGLVDYPDDPGCDSPTDDDETDDCPDGPSCPACANGQDDDGDGKTDYPDDPSCHAASGTSESCDSTEGVTALTMPTTSGDSSGAANDVDPTCASSSGSGPDVVYSLTVPHLTSLSIDQTGSFDSVLELLDGTCGGTALACVDNPSIARTNVAAGTYYLVVDGYYDTEYGSFQVAVAGTIAAGERCDGPLAQSGALTCDVGYSCQGTGTPTCQLAACNDGVDNDSDGLKDYPDDPGCDSPSDDDETDDCPNGPNCPACSNGQDDDADGLTDYPDDPDCASAADTTESCDSMDPIGELTQGTTDGDTTGHANDFHASCGDNPGGDGADDLWQLDLPAMTHLNINADDNLVDTVVVLYGATCGGTELACEDYPEILDLTSVAAGRYYLLIDTDYGSSDEGPYNIVVTGEIAPDGSCEVPLAQSGAITCGTGYACQGPSGGQTCQPAACSDGVDNDSDGLKDYPDDPGCDSPDDNDETDDCPDGPNCPACGNGKDDDSDGLYDYPDDFGCASAAGTTEAFCPADSDPTAAITMATTSGTTTGATDDFVPSCQSSSSAPDKVYGLVLPVAVDSLTLDTNGSTFDTVLSLSDNTCSAAGELSCADDGGSGGGASSLTATQLAPGAYSVIVDGYMSGEGAFLLHASGIAAAGSACTSPLFSTGVLSCPAGQTCQAGTCK